MTKDKAIKLRKQGLSYNEIQKILGTAKSTLSYWLKDIELSDSAKNKIANNKYQKNTLKLIKRNKNQSKIARDNYNKIISKAIKEFDKYKNDPFFISGISLYWAEGYKKGADKSKWKVIDFANSDKHMIKLMMLFFRKYLKVPEEKYKAQIIIHPNCDLKKSLSIWSDITDIKKDKFIKSFSKTPNSSKGIRNKKSLPNGTLHIRIYDVKQFFRIIS